MFIHAHVLTHTQVNKRLLLTYVAVLPREDLQHARGGYERGTYDRRDAEQQGRAELEDLVDRAFVDEVVMHRWNPDKFRD